MYSFKYLPIKKCFQRHYENHPFKIDACVILPDHLHCIWTLPNGDNDFSTRWRLIKSNFSRNCEQQYHQKVSLSRQSKKEQSIWQRRFWEHQIRDQEDLANHIDYIYYNPVKHGLVKAPKDWEYSSFHRYVAAGIYDLSWGSREEMLFDVSVGHE
ncbi:transposase [Trichocoleus sp. ST-U2]|uniref:REP-associated tyrosine transposase n=1 Tax=Coleofasciculus sp. FACHB-SPT9 TaxID=2692791 RepID=UPI001F550E89|nr:transposase [Coleofasciculus sp. FACHB-SPT9]